VSARLALAQRRLGELARGDIDDDADAIGRASRAVPGQRHGEIRPDDFAIAADIPLFHVERRNLAGHQAAEPAQILAQVLGMGQFLEAALQQLVALQPQHFAELLIDAQKASVERHMRDADGGQLECGPQILSGAIKCVRHQTSVRTRGSAAILPSRAALGTRHSWD
jgi:hypothetical protein